MIEAEIRGPIAKKEYDKLKKLLASAGENAREEFRVTLTYTERGFNNREVRIEHRQGISSIYIHSGKAGERTETVTDLAKGGFGKGADMLAELGYKKGTVSAERVFTCKYGGAAFALVDPGDESYYYEAVMTAKGATEAKEAEQKLQKLAKQFKLPIWSPLDMLGFLRKVHTSGAYAYDHTVEGTAQFKDKFGI